MIQFPNKRTGITAGFEPAGGGYAEYARVMPFVLPGVVKIPARNTFAEGAMLESVNTVLKAVKCLSLLRGDSVLVAAVIAVPSDAAMLQAMELVRGSAQILLFAHTMKGIRSQVDFSRICLNENDLIGSYSADYTLQNEVARLIFSRRLDIRPLITHTFPLSETPGRHRPCLQAVCGFTETCCRATIYN